MVWKILKRQKDKPLEKRIEEEEIAMAEKKFKTFVEAVAVIYMRQNPLSEYYKLWSHIEDEIKKRALDRQKEFIGLAIKYDITAPSQDRVASVLSYKGLQHLVDSGYLICERVDELESRLSRDPENKKVIDRIKGMGYQGHDRICMLEKDAGTFMKIHGISPEEYIRKLEEEIIRSNPTYRLIVKLKQSEITK